MVSKLCSVKSWSCMGDFVGVTYSVLFTVKSVNIFLINFNCILWFSSTSVCIIDDQFISVCSSPVTKFSFSYMCTTFLFLKIKVIGLKKFVCVVPSITLLLCMCSAEHPCAISQLFTVDLK